MLLTILLALSPVYSLAAGGYYETESVEKPKRSSSKPLITKYKGDMVGSQNRQKIGRWFLNCPHGSIRFTTIESPGKNKVSATVAYGGGASTIRGDLDKNSGSFVGYIDDNNNWRTHLKGKVFEKTIEGSVWFELRNHHLKQNGLCVTNFSIAKN